MRFNPFRFLVSGSLLTAGLLACAIQNPEPSLVLPNAPATMEVGDTLNTAPATVTSPDLTGRMVTNANFRNYFLVSDDTLKLRASGTSLIGKSAGAATFSAHANDGSGLVSAKYSITVIIGTTL